MRLRSTIILAMAVLMLGGCALRQEHKEAQQTQEKQRDQSEAKQQTMEEQGRTTPMRVVEDRFITSQGARVDQATHLPSHFDKTVSVQIRDKVGFQQLLNRLSGLTNVSVKTAQHLTAEELGGKKDNLFYEGSLSGLLDRIASRYNIYWRFEEGELIFFRTRTRTFRLVALAGQSDFSASVKREQGGSGDNASGAENQTGQAPGAESGAELQASDVSVWSAVRDGIESIVSENGTYSVSQATGTVTVTDEPHILRRVESYVEQQNESLGQQVIIKAQLFTVRNSNETEAGINWDVVREATDLNLRSISQDFNPQSSVTDLAAGIFKVDVPQSSSSDYAGSSAFVEALRNQNDLSLVTESSVVTLNNQPVPLQIGNQISFLESVSRSQTTQAGTLTELEPGIINTGTSMTFWPHIMNSDRVLLQFSLNLSTLEELNTVESGGEQIQTPEIRQRSLTQRAALSNGETLVLTGFSRNSARTSDKTSLFGVGQSSGKQREDLVLVLTPRIIPAPDRGER